MTQNNLMNVMRRKTQNCQSPLQFISEVWFEWPDGVLSDEEGVGVENKALETSLTETSWLVTSPDDSSSARAPVVSIGSFF